MNPQKLQDDVVMDAVEKCDRPEKELHELTVAGASSSGPVTGKTPQKPPPGPTKTAVRPAGLDSFACNDATLWDDNQGNGVH